MRTNVVIDDQLMKKAKLASRAKTKKDTIEAGLNLLIKINKQERIKKYKGKLKWEGNLEKMRIDK